MDGSGFEQVLSQLNEPQRQAVITTEGPVLVIAGAGSGKTRVLTTRVAYLIANGIPPERIVAMTFTNKAADELRERIAHLCDPWAARRVWAGTFHSIFARLLRRNADVLGFSATYTIYDEDDSLALIRRLLKEQNISATELSPQTVRTAISRAKNDLIVPEEYARQAATPRQQKIATIYHHYQRVLRRANAMDFDDLLLHMIDLLSSSDEILQMYQELFHYIHVDEYQDTNRAQYEVLKLLAGGHRNLFAVGDDAQSIYSWRGARVENIFEFQRDFPEHRLIRLEQNYRSTQVILDVANALISHNPHQIPKRLWTAHHGGDLVRVVSYWDEADEAAGIVRMIEEMRAQSIITAWSDVAVLYRINAQSKLLEDEFRRAEIPYRIIGGISFYKRKEIKDALAYLRLLLNPHDDEAFLRIVNEPPRGIGEATLDHLRQWAHAQGVSLLNAAQNARQISTIAKQKQLVLEQIGALVATTAERLTTMPLGEVVHTYLDAVGLLQYYKLQATDEALDRYENLARLIADITQYAAAAESGEQVTLADYMQRVSLLTSADESASGDAVHLMTLHAAKGLEFPVVIIAGLVEGLLPLIRATSTESDRFEERRLFYVGITRAKRHLVLTYPRQRSAFGLPEQSLPSSFLAELPIELLDANRPEDFARKDIARLVAGLPVAEKKRSSRQSNGETIQYRRGMRVLHPTFGEGVILAVEGRGAETKLSVHFDTVGTKLLLARYAPLQKVD
ncbi:MAG: UvrD-helicase domain-containing protein [Candidatus Kapabacteria bacterium]|nr:UvrD-helicase domain-containing protein [Candidatus Kapabacteria bacterium]